MTRKRQRYDWHSIGLPCRSIQPLHLSASYRAIGTSISLRRRGLASASKRATVTRKNQRYDRPCKTALRRSSTRHNPDCAAVKGTTMPGKNQRPYKTALRKSSSRHNPDRSAMCSKGTTMTGGNQRYDRSYDTVLLQSSCPRSSGAAEKSMLYIVHYHSCLYDNNYDDLIYTVHAIDIHHPPVEYLPSPILTLSCKEFHAMMGVGRVGSSIYFIGGLIDLPLGEPISKDVYIFDTAKLVGSYPASIANPKEFLRKGPDLKGGKLDPIVVTVGGKIYAIARSFDPSKEKENPKPRVEVLDPDLATWVVLPEPVFPHSPSGICSYEVDAFDVVGSRIILWVGSMEWFELDTIVPHIGWVPRSSDKALRSTIGGSEVVAGRVYPWYPFPCDDEFTAYLIDFDIAMLETRDVNMRVGHPLVVEKKSPITLRGRRRLLDCGNGRGIVFSSGYGDGYDGDAGHGPFFYTLDVVRLESQGGNLPITLVLEKSLSYEVGITNFWNHVLGCFLI